MSLLTHRIMSFTTLITALGLTACGGLVPKEESSALAGPSNAIGSSNAIGPTDDSTEYGERTRAHLVNHENARIGDVVAWQGQNGIVIEIDVRDLPPGGHGLHLHSRGDCSDIGAFKASGGHITKDEQPHGFLHPNGTHAGDLPNIYVHSDGTARIDLLTRDISVTDLVDADGAAVIIHAERDDYQTQPIGNAGARVACAAFTPRSN